MNTLPEPVEAPPALAEALVERAKKAFDHGDAFWIPVAGALAALTAVWNFVQEIKTEAHAFPARAIGPAILSGIDPSRRVPAFVTTVLIALGCFFGVQALFSALWRWARAGAHPEANRQVSAALAGTFGVGLLVTFAEVALMKPQSTAGLMPAVLGIFLALAALVSGRLQRHLPTTLVAACAALPMAGWFAWQTSQGVEIRLPLAKFAELLGGTLALWAVLAFVLRKRNAGAVWRFSRRVELAATPLFFIPAMPIVGSELAWHQTLAQQVGVPTATVAMRLVIGLTALAVALFILFPVLAGRWPNAMARLGRRLPAYLWAPAGVATASLYLTWVPRITHGLDLLHLGNHLVPTHQLLNFGQLPFVDVWYARGLQDILPALGYRLFNGAALNLDAETWVAPFNAAIAAVLGYLVLRALTTTWTAALLVVFVPTLSFFLQSYYAFAMMPGLVFLWVAQAPSRRRFTVLWLAVLLAFVWMPSVGMGAAPAIAALTVLFALRDRRWAVRPLLQSFAAVYGGALVLYAVLILLRGHQLRETFALVRVFSLADPLIGSYHNLWNNESATVVATQYALLPVVGLTALFIAGWQIVAGRQTKVAVVMLAYLAAAGLLIFLRAFHRHCLGEGFQPSFLVFVACMLPLAVRQSRAVAFSLAGAIALVFALTLFGGIPPGVEGRRVALLPHLVA